jgi:predicted DNA-binding transcriptional regulator AlpA
MSALANIPTDLNRERLLDTTQTAEFLGMSVPHFRRLYRARKVPSPIKIGERKYGWRLGGLIDFVASKTRGAQ